MDGGGIEFWLQYDTHFDSGATIPLLVKKEPDLYGQYPAYTAVRYEADGFEVLSQKTVEEGEDFRVRISPDQPADRLAVLKLTVMNGETQLVTLSFYGIQTERGVYVYYVPTVVWEFYYTDRYEAGEFTENEWFLILPAILSAKEPALEDPVKAAGLA